MNVAWKRVDVPQEFDIIRAMAVDRLCTLTKRGVDTDDPNCSDHTVDVHMGGNIADAEASNDYWVMWRATSKLCRWLDISIVPQIYEARCKSPTQSTPEQTTMRRLVEAVRATILRTATEYVLRLDCRHVSKEIGGLRVECNRVAMEADVDLSGPTDGKLQGVDAFA